MKNVLLKIDILSHLINSELNNQNIKKEYISKDKISLHWINKIRRNDTD